MIRAKRDKKSAENFSTLMPDLTPMLDVIFILLIFFILTANATPMVMDMVLPKETEGASKRLDDTPPLTIQLFKEEGKIAINKEVFTSKAAFEKALLAAVKSDDNRRMVIAADKDVRVERLLQLLAFSKKHNIKTAEILTRTERLTR